jgi:hypothetical protein
VAVPVSYKMATSVTSLAIKQPERDTNNLLVLPSSTEVKNIYRYVSNVFRSRYLIK